MNVLDLFSGTGELGRMLHAGLKEALGIEARTVAYCEKDRFCQALLMSRMWRGEIDAAPICTDMHELRASDFLLRVDIVVGGWPCQGNSAAGHRKGMADERSALVTEVARVVCEFQPSLVFLENVAGVLTAPGDGVGFVANALAELGYEFRHILLSASEVGASHERERFWLMAHSQRKSDQSKFRNAIDRWAKESEQIRMGRGPVGDAERLGSVRLEGCAETGGGHLYHSKLSTWATPQARDYRGPDMKGSKNIQRKLKAGYTVDLNSQAAHLHQETGKPGEEFSEPTPKLNPLFVEWLLGSPIGMTELEPWATEWIQSARRKPSKS